MIFRIQSFRQAAFWSTAISGFSQGLALLFGVLMAAVFGAGEGTDILYYSIGIFALISQLVQSGNVSVLIPEAMRRRHQIGEEDAMAFINRFMVFIGILIAIVTLLLLWNPVKVFALFSRFSTEALARHSRLVFWLVLSFPLQVVAQLLLDVLVSYKFLALPATLSCVNRVLSIVIVWCFHGRLGLLSVPLGMTLGFAFQVLLNLGLLHGVVKWRVNAWRTRIESRTIHNILWVELGNGVTSLAGYLPLFLYSGFSAGILTAMNYARRMSNVPVELLAQQISAVTAVKFNELVARRQGDELNAELGRIARLLLFILVPVAVLLGLIGSDLTQILFGHGKFRGEAVSFSAVLFSAFMLNLPLTGINTIFARYIVARQAIRYAVGWNFFSSLLNMAVMLFAVTRWGPIGFPIGIFLHMLIYLMLLSVSMRRWTPGLSLWPVWRAYVLTMAACGVAAVPAWLFRMRWGSGLPHWGNGMVSAALFSFAYGALLFFLPPDQMSCQYALQVVRRVSLKIRHSGKRTPNHPNASGDPAHE